MRFLRLQLYINVYKFACEINPIPIKAALGAMGYIKDELRLPLTSMEGINRNRLLEEMENLNII